MNLPAPIDQTVHRVQCGRCGSFTVAQEATLEIKTLVIYINTLIKQRDRLQGMVNRHERARRKVSLD